MIKRLALLIVISFASSFICVAARPLQTRDHLTEKEIDLVKDAQELDQRIDVFIKAMNRRLLVIKGMAGDPKELKRDAELWGDLPAGTRSDLVGDIARILDEAITNVDDVSARDEKNPALPKALRKLANEANRIIDQLKPLQAQASGPAEISNFEQTMENAQTIVEAAQKLGPEVVQKSKSKGEKKDVH